MLKNFLEETVAAVEEKMGACYQVKTEHILKNNGVELDSILIMREGENITPSIYLNDYYEEYKSGKTVDMIAREVIAGYHQCMAKREEFLAEMDFSFPNYKYRIFYRLINFKQNQKLFEEIPYIPFLDLAITFYCLVERRDEAIGTLLITNDLMKGWGIGKAELLKLAMENTPRLFPIRIRTMDEIVEGMLQRDLDELVRHYRNNGISEAAVEEAKAYGRRIMDTIRKNREAPIYVLTNTSGINGAAALLYEKELENFAASCQSDFYVLPSSVHEALLIPCNGKFDEEELRAMVCEVNQTEVPVEDVLSNEVYLYRRDGNRFEWKGKYQRNKK